MLVPEITPRTKVLAWVYTSFSDREDNDLVRRVGGRSNRLDQWSFRGLYPLSRTSGMSISLQRGLLIYMLCSLA